uniref:LUC7 like 3 pre-mRNA splicing factor n=1 Tax=Monodelphis domestica TaxID=13616 RepID=A0A5F8HB44_MONDO
MISALQLLNELMGRDRNLGPDEKYSNVWWDHESLCKCYLCGFCPVELFTNTRRKGKGEGLRQRKMQEKSFWK